MCHLLTGHSYYSFCFLGNFFFFFSNYERNLGWWYNIAFLLLLKSFSFLIFPSKEPRWLNIRAPQHLLIAQVDLLCMHSPSVQFLDCKTRPSQSLPPFLGAGAVHSLLRQCVHSVPQVDHLLFSQYSRSITEQCWKKTFECGHKFPYRAQAEIEKINSLLYPVLENGSTTTKI